MTRSRLKVAVLGAGMVGKEIAKDLARRFDVTAVDRSQDVLDAAFAGKAGRAVKTRRADLSKAAALRRAIASADLVVGALPGFMGRAALETIIRAGKPVVDISFFPEDPFALDGLAKAKGVTAIVDMGVSPGMGNVFAGYHHKRMKSLERLEIVVGGLPVVREFPFEYKAPFSPYDVIELYTRPARYVENGVPVVRPALSDPELMFVEGVGTLESFNTDGLRTLAQTIACPNMRERTLRYPGHIRLMQALRDVGFFDPTPIDVGGSTIAPLDFTARLVFPKWRLGEREEEFTVVRLTIEGTTARNRRERMTYDLLDRYDHATGATSMARTTGYTCAAAVHLLADGAFSRPGICPPEYVGEDEACFRFLLEYLDARGVRYRRTVTPL